MPEAAGGEHSELIMIGDLNDQDTTGKRVEAGRESERRGDPIEPAVAPHAVPGESLDLLPPDHDRPAGSHAFESQSVGGVLTRGAEPGRRLDRGPDVDRRPGLRSTRVMMGSPSPEAGRVRSRRQVRGSIEQFLRSSARRLQPCIGVLSGRGDEQIRRSIAKRICAGGLEHEDEPGEAGRIHPASPVEHGATDSKPIRGLHGGPGNRSDLAVQTDLIESIDLSSACFPGEIPDPKRQR